MVAPVYLVFTKADLVAGFAEFFEAQTPEDMGQMVVYLASAPHVTGQALAVDGGFSL
mgnify:CR=1 FL=1